MTTYKALLAICSLLLLPSFANSGVIAHYDFDPVNLTGTRADVDASSQVSWATSDLFDNATGTGALEASNQGFTNRRLFSGSTDNYLNFSSNREGDPGLPNGPIGESTWLTFSVTPAPGYKLDFTGQNATIDTYANSSLAATLSPTTTDWSLYFREDGVGSWTLLSTSFGASVVVAGNAGPLEVAWDLSPMGVKYGTTEFLLDPQSTGGTNGTTGQRGTGFDNLTVNANLSPVPEPTSVALWGIGMLGVAVVDRLRRKVTV